MIWPILPTAVTAIGDSVCIDCRTRDGAKTGHDGLDIYAPGGTVVVSPVSGTVLRVVNGSTSDDDHAKRAGLWVDIQAKDGKIHRLLHLGHASVSSGQSIKEGATVGDVASQGSGVDSSGRHLHYEIRQKPTGGTAYGDPEDPRGPLADILLDKAYKASEWMFLDSGNAYKDEIRGHIATARKQDDPGKKLSSARAIFAIPDDHPAYKRLYAQVSDSYYYLFHRKEGVEETAKGAASKAVELGKKAAEGAADAAGSLWDIIPLWG
jgi:murein DD-endopeptidase MepM/ murein hydrolase activator NlpD